jgi:hypothetical protein
MAIATRVSWAAGLALPCFARCVALRRPRPRSGRSLGPRTESAGSLESLIPGVDEIPYWIRGSSAEDGRKIAPGQPDVRAGPARLHPGDLR